MYLSSYTCILIFCTTEVTSYLCTYVSIYLSIYLSFYLYIYLSFYLSIYDNNNNDLSMYLAIHAY